MAKLTTDDRTRIGALLDYLVKEQARIHYPHGDVRTTTVHQIATMRSLNLLIEALAGLTCDCSQFVQLVFHVALCADPMGRGFRMDGFTGTLLAALPVYMNARAAETGAIVIFGPDTGEHAAIVRHPDPHGGNPGLVSHGQEAGPLEVKLAVEAAAHRQPVRFLNVSQLGL